MKIQKHGIFLTKARAAKSVMLPLGVALWLGWAGDALGEGALLSPSCHPIFDDQKWTEEELVRELSQHPRGQRQFYLYQALLTRQIQAYDAKRGEIDSLLQLLRPCFFSEKASFPEGDTDQERIFQSYRGCIECAYQASWDIAEKSVSDESLFSLVSSFPLYFLELLEMEERLNFHLLGTEVLIQCQIEELSSLFERLTRGVLASAAENENGDGLIYKEQRLYHRLLVPLICECLHRIDREWNLSDCNRKELLELLFGAKACALFPYDKGGNKSLIDCAFAFLLRYGEVKWAEERLAQEAKATAAYPYAFYLRKQLIEQQLHLQEIAQEGSSLSSLLRCLFEKNDESRSFEGLSQEKRNLATSYFDWLDLAEATDESARKERLALFPSSLPAQEPSFYFLEILAFEEAFSLDVFGASLLVAREVTAFKNWLNDLALKKEQAKGDFGLEEIINRLYWEEVVPRAHRLLCHLDSSFHLSSKERVEILDSVFGSLALRTFPLLSEGRDEWTLFWPFLIREETLDLLRGRFYEQTAHLTAWDQSFQWVALHVQAAQELLSIDPSLATLYLKKAREIADQTLWSYSFSFNWASWNEKKRQALEQIEACQQLLDRSPL